ncbi:hypothetical membrane protein [Alicycliphilus sp. B1]|nr:hypothetical membrane protein [Alicycliphilus sp. B1]
MGTMTPCALHRTVEREHGERRRAVDEHEVVVLVHLGQRGLQAALAVLQRNELDLGAGQLAVGAQHVVAALLGRHGGLLDGARFEQHVVHAERELALVHARTHRGIALRIQVHEQHALAYLGQARGEVDGGGGLAHATLLVGNAEDLGHAGLYFEMASLMPKPMRKVPAVFSSTRTTVGFARMRSAR